MNYPVSISKKAQSFFSQAGFTEAIITKWLDDLCKAIPPTFMPYAEEQTVIVPRQHVLHGSDFDKRPIVVLCLTSEDGQEFLRLEHHSDVFKEGTDWN